nr:hypothetical protein [Pseudomonas sp. BIGb0427]
MLVGWLVFRVVAVELADTLNDDSSAYTSDLQECSSEPLQILFGQEVGKEVLLVAKVLSGVSSVRVLSTPGRDLSYVPDRLNLEVNEQQRIYGGILRLVPQCRVTTVMQAADFLECSFAFCTAALGARAWVVYVKRQALTVGLEVVYHWGGSFMEQGPVCTHPMT